MNTSLSRLRSFYSDLSPPLLLHALIKREFAGSIGLLLSGSARCESLLATASVLDLRLPVLVTGGQEIVTLALNFGFTDVQKVEDSSYIIESKALLAIVEDNETPPHSQKITLDEEGVFRIYPYLVTPPEQDKPIDWAL